MSESSHALDGFSSIMPTLLVIFFLAVWIVLIGVAVSAIMDVRRKEKRIKRKNDASPRMSVPARVSSKRISVSLHRRVGAPFGANITRYFATFEVKSGDRMELSLHGRDYGLLAEGDTGTLHFQGKRFLRFDRKYNRPTPLNAAVHPFFSISRSNSETNAFSPTKTGGSLS